MWHSVGMSHLQVGEDVNGASSYPKTGPNDCTGDGADSEQQHQTADDRPTPLGTAKERLADLDATLTPAISAPPSPNALM